MSGSGAFYQVPPHTDYGADPYATPSPSAPYTTPPPPSVSYAIPAPPSPPSPPPQKKSTAFIIGAVALALVVVGGGLFFFLSSYLTTVNEQAKARATATASASFSTATVTARSSTATAVASSSAATATAVTATGQNPYPPQTGTLILNDPMHDNSKGYHWIEGTSDDKDNGDVLTCAYRDGAYHLTRQKDGYIYCGPTVFTLGNVAFEVRLTLVKGDQAGIMVRFDETSKTGYMFLINTKGQYYIYSLRWKDPNPDRHYTKLRSGVNEAIKKGLNQSNLLAVVANGNTISVFANSVYLDSVQDSSFTSGEIDIWGGNKNASGTDLVAADARAWRL